ncbi:MAG: UDP-2,3-diacylglucosamine diphosphatase, partial [Pseudomonadota bacterium]
MANAPEFDHTFCSGNPVTGRSVFISDLHLGTKGCRSELLLDFLSHLVIENLFLVGDIIDLERMQQTVHWPSSHTAVIQQILKMAASGTRVMYIPGNHDARIRALAGAEVHGVQIRLNPIHETADGRRVLVT